MNTKTYDSYGLTKMNKNKRDKEKTGPKPETIQVDGDWKNAVEKALKKKKPESGWPRSGKKDE